eukprot:TRINITY_DN24181_c0_g2_i1.p1 TRINITY_DN24181_c0_g2~~TRINITY_DN24181_c0_g2_i1.p1  ORF type:complete len:562 (+),score=100.62 TRINITY_DN24181_c0_g2_i1:177-1862(+)
MSAAEAAGDPGCAEDCAPCDGEDPEQCLFVKISTKAPKAVHMAFHNLGWLPVADAPQDDSNAWWSICWKGHFKVGEYERALPHQRINHFPKAGCISRKDHLLRGMRKAHAVHGAIYNICPQAFVLPSEYTRFCDEYASQPEDKKATWICKPHNSSQGRNIFIIQNLHDLSYDSQYVIQKYVDRPLLISGYKFDLRIYVLTTSVHPLKVYIYRDGLARFSSDKYDMNSLDNMYSHLTNTSINKHVGLSGERKSAVGAGCKWSLMQLQEYTEQSGGSWDKLWQRIKNVCVLTMLLLVQSVPKGTEACFELYGVDVIIDDQLKPWILEVNSGPAMGLDEQVDRAVKIPLLEDTVRLIGSTPTARQHVMKQQAAESKRRRPRLNSKPAQEPKVAASPPVLGGFEQAFPFDDESAGLSASMADDSGAFKSVVDMIRDKEIAMNGTKVHIRASSACNKTSRTRPRPGSSAVNRQGRGTTGRTSSGLKSSTLDAVKASSRTNESRATSNRMFDTQSEVSSVRTSCGLKSSTIEAMKRSQQLSSNRMTASRQHGSTSSRGVARSSMLDR